MDDVQMWVLAIVTISVVRSAPSIIWAIRCPSNSARYKVPSTPVIILRTSAIGERDDSGT